MKIVYLLLLVLGLYLVFSYVRFRYILGHANLPSIEQKDQTLGTGPTLIYVAAGDSTAVGEGASSVEKTYPYAILKYLAQSHTVVYKNVAVSGATTQDLIDHQLNSIINNNPDVVTISIGANDVTHWVATAKTVANYHTIIDRLTKETHAEIYITNVPRLDRAYLLPWIFRQYYDAQCRKANKNLISLETDRVVIVDIHSVDVNNSADKFHPSDIGYGYWSDAFLAKIKP